MQISIPGYKELDIENIVFDYNGTIALNGYVLDNTKELLKKLSNSFNIYVITADTFNSVEDELKELDLKVKVLSSSNHTKEKGEFINSLGADKSISIGNGNNDAYMLKNAIISIAIIEDEGCSINAILNSNIVCKSISSAIDILLNRKKLIATLRS